jgi:hypothetical protein
MEAIVMMGVNEYAEGFPVYLDIEDNDDRGDPLEEKRLVVLAKNEGGYNCTEVDLLQLIAWLKDNKPELLA